MSDSQYIDISYPIHKDMAIYPGNPAYSREIVSDIDKGDGATVSRIIIGSHTGTHIDAPAHFIQGGKTLDWIPLERMNGKAKVIDATGYNDIGVDLIKTHSIDEDDIVLFRTDNSICWSCDRILDRHVTITYEAAEFLVQCGIKLVGIDYLTIERPRELREQGRSIHKTLLGNDILICEALMLKDVCEGEYEFLCMPLKMEHSDGSPSRCVLKSIR